MKKILLILLLLCGIVFSSQAQDMRTLFMDAPDTVFPLLPRNARADCVDFADAGMEYPVTNLLGGNSVLKKLTDEYLFLQSTSVSSVEMKKLPMGDSFVICVVKSVSAEATDSRVCFYNSNWEKIDTSSLFTAPSIEDFFFDEEEHILDLCDIYLVMLKLDAHSNTLVAEYTMPDYMNIDDARKVRALLKNITYRWNGERFVKE